MQCQQNFGHANQLGHKGDVDVSGYIKSLVKYCPACILHAFVVVAFLLDVTVCRTSQADLWDVVDIAC
mgnify:CR=1 FL=1